MTERARVIGTSVPKRDGADKVTGRTRFLHDLELPRLAHGKILRARHPHARLVKIDTRRAPVGAALGVRMCQHILTIDLVVQSIKAVPGFCLRFRV